jgi:hypothetical protein
MIQRIQSLWLLLAGAAGLLTYKFPIWTGTLQDGKLKRFVGTENLFFFALTIATCILAFVAIFFFKDRKTQKNMAWIGLLLSLVLIALEVWLVNEYKTSVYNNLKTSTWNLGAIMPILMLVFFALAIGGIRSDEKVIKSLERLR